MEYCHNPTSMLHEDDFKGYLGDLTQAGTQKLGWITEEVESLVTVPLENALNGTPNLKTIRSKSVLGLSSIVLIFQDGTDLMEFYLAGCGGMSNVVNQAYNCTIP